LVNIVCFSLYSTLSKRLMQTMGSPLYVTAHITVLGTVALIAMSLTSDWSLVGKLNQTQWTSVLYLALICSGLGYLMWNFALSALEAVKAAVWLYLEPVPAFIGEAVVFGVLPSFTTVIGGGVILVGVLLINRSKE
jgi:drug/metabolite transporter (DMT)-like permease